MIATLLAAALGWQFIPGGFVKGQSPDGNTVLIDAPQGLIAVDTGRHQAHQNAILAAANARGKPIAAIVNTHWHLDHTGGNAEIRAAFSGIPIIASDAVDGALRGFLPRSRKSADEFLASGKASTEQADEIRRDAAAINDVANLRPTQVVVETGPISIAGRMFDVRLERYAATAGDVWLYDPKAKLAVVGDLVVGLVPFMDTACPDGWRIALGHIASAPFKTLIPGHGEPMDRAGFDRWRTAFDNLLDCAAGSADKQVCANGWVRDAAAFIPETDKSRAAAYANYYIESRLRAAPEEKARFCPGGTG
jgi:glyoxylase-like metal-dependent hydrolase (beta-lactamase superfamily II)